MKSLLKYALVILIGSLSFAHATDTDGDGLSDDLEVSVGMNPNDDSDFFNDTDGDGVFDGEEALDGTDLNDAESYLDMLDRSLGDNGLVSYEFFASGEYDENYPGVLMEDSFGRLYVGGELDGDDSAFYFARLTSDFELDTTFSDDGYFVGPDYSISGEYIRVLELDDDKPLLAVNSCTSNSCLVAIDEDGLVDETRFSLATQPGIYEFSQYFRNGMEMLTASDSSRYIAYGTTGSNGASRVIKMKADETIDDTFNSNLGYFTLNLSGEAGGEYPTGVWPALDEDYLVGIRVVASGDTGIYLTKFDETGAFDSNWGTDGTLQIDPTNDYRHFTLLPDEDGYWVFAILGTSSNDGVALLRLNADGSVDESFGDNGRLLYEDHSGATYYIEHLDKQADGTLIIVASISGGADDAGVFAARVLPTGELDTSFYGNGIARFKVGDFYAGVSSATLLHNHDIAFTGSLYNELDGSLSTYLMVIPNESDIDGDGIEDYLDDVDDRFVEEEEEPVVEEDVESEEPADTTTEEDDVPNENKHEVSIWFGSFPVWFLGVVTSLLVTRRRS